MYYETAANRHGMRHDPFKAVVVPRPIGWVSTVAASGVLNLAPYSFFNAVSDKPPMVVFSSGGRKDSLRNIEQSGEFCFSLATHALRNAMNMSSAAVAPDVDEFALAGLTPAESVLVKAPRVAESPVALECRLWKILPLPAPRGTTESFWTVVLGEVVGVYIDDRYLRDGRVDVAAIQPIARLGYMDYAVVGAENIFELNRPVVSADGKSARCDAKAWDGVYR
jgi:flavin reductase (DIM6/NTAB) family NADH-FMN oxidoreductase RutF